MLERKALKNKAYQIRQDVLHIIVSGKTGHTGGDLSETDILTVLYYNVLRYDVKNPEWECRDRFILSKGHSVEAYLAILADIGFVDPDELKTYSKYQSRLIGHPNNKLPGVEMNSGALGHGLSTGVGMAIAGKMDKRDYRVFVLMGDGEQAEGSIWEAAMAASHYGLDNLVAIVDRNHLQISGGTEDVMCLEPFKAKWEAFGFDVTEIDGHDYEQIEKALNHKTPGKPSLVLANTVKGKGVSFMENDAKWHHGVPNSEQYESALKELKAVCHD